MSFLTDLPIKNSFIEIEYNHTDKCQGSKSSKRNDNRANILNNPYLTVHTNPKAMQSNYIKDSFLSKTDRFQKLSQDKILNPGPGTYQLSSTIFTINNTSLSSKGYGVGFVSKGERFHNREEEKKKYSPGPGDYKYERYKDMQYSINNSLQGQSLYTSKVTHSQKQRETAPGPWSYNPIKTQEISDPLHGPSFHKLKSKRFKMMLNNIPGPGTYTEQSGSGKQQYKNKPSFFFTQPKKIKEDYLKKYQIKTELTKGDTSFKLKQNIKDGQLLKAKICSIAINTKRSQLLQIGTQKNKTQKEEEDFEYEYNKEKKDLFELAPPRWKKDKHQFLVPGPAFYCPKISQPKLSFNQNNRAFVYSPGVLFSSTAPYPSIDQ